MKSDISPVSSGAGNHSKYKAPLSLRVEFVISGNSTWAIIFLSKTGKLSL